jgi:NAD-dependent DNA ligase
MKGFGEKTVEKLDFEELHEVFSFSKQYYIDTLGETMGNKLYAEAQAARSSDLSLVLASFSIPLIGETASAKICSVVSSISEISPETCKLAGLGEKATYNLCSWLAVTDLSQYPFDFKSKAKETTIGVISKNTNVCITGKLSDYKKRDDAAAYLKSLGFGITDSVTKSTNVLVDEEGKQSSKRTKAESLNIPILTIKELLEKY